MKYDSEKANTDIRVILCGRGITHNRCAKEVGITCYTFSRWLATPLNEERRARVLDAIDSIIKQRNEGEKKKV